MSRYTWPVARRYVIAPLALGVPLALRGHRTGRALLALAAMIAAFFRDPDRPLPENPSLVYAAADGLITSVEHDVAEPWLPGGKGTRVSVFLSLVNVHVNRSPIAGTLTRSDELGGSAVPAFLAKADTNRRNRLALSGAAGPVVVVQVAGMLARTITNWAGVGDRVVAGQRLGIIHFGSRTDVLLPSGAAEVLVPEGARVRGGVTPIARLRAQG
ncbi:MAG TPA: phosphatidylserine decarboxylase [Thermoleophilaceae bacterium]|nr:phosphatidylserine decarboxylase [Thermoleophilaceae bacterium]